MRGPPSGVLGADIWIEGPVIIVEVLTMVGGDIRELYWEEKEDMLVGVLGPFT